MSPNPSFDTIERTHKRGSVVFIPKYQFHQITKSKYALLIEDFKRDHIGTVVTLITTNLQFKKYPSCVFLPKKTIPRLDEDSLIDCNNTHIIHHSKMLGTIYIASMPLDVMDNVCEAFKYAFQLEQSLVARIAVAFN